MLISVHLMEILSENRRSTKIKLLFALLYPHGARKKYPSVCPSVCPFVCPKYLSPRLARGT